MNLGVIVWQELDAQGDFFDGLWPVFVGTNHEIDLDMGDFVVPGSPWMNMTDEFKSELSRLGFADGIMPRGMGNGDTAFYALDMREYYDEDIVRIALIDVA